MCGLFGVVKFTPSLSTSETRSFLNCLNALSHRGPDNHNYYEDKDVFLGSTRLSIVDRSRRAHMPLTDAKQRFYIIFNGEIYNFKELKRKYLYQYRFRSESDTEVLLALYTLMGVSCLPLLRGMFAFAIWDKARGELFIARDQLGKKPLKYYTDTKHFIFASELKALLLHPGVKKRIDPTAIDQFLTYQYVPSPRTGFENIRKLEPGHYCLISKDGGIHNKQYWSPQILPKVGLGSNEVSQQIQDKLSESVRLRLGGDVPIGAHLSGGTDSSLVVALMADSLKKPFHTFSVGFADAQYSELPFARMVADRFKTVHHEIVVEANVIDLFPKIVAQYEEPYADPSMLPTYVLCKETKKSVTVALNGDGGDELFGGYQRYAAYALHQLISTVPLRNTAKNWCKRAYKLTGLTSLRHLSMLLEFAPEEKIRLYQKLIGAIDIGTKQKLYTNDFRNKITTPALDYLSRAFEALPKDVPPLERLQVLDLVTYLSENLTTKTDIAGMAFALEVRSPLLDQEFIQLVLRTRLNQRTSAITPKKLLKSIALSRHVPYPCIARSKKGFGIPLRKWITDDWREIIKPQLLSPSFINLGIIQKKALNNLMENNEDTPPMTVWTLFALKTWADTWFSST